ncbi:hypothetical protein [Hoylesella nanceiensis]|uniref:hypothetical protein n=1 Tax=Hoylesella nanceiensis TaxID=425941 RepID=UPI0028EB8590|nr:hypothetical protein [Hoylesella nanceiensis]
MINNDAKVLLLLLTRKKNVLKRYNAASLPLSFRLHISLIINAKDLDSSISKHDFINW